MAAMSSIAPFLWSPHVLQDVWAAMLEDDTWRYAFFAKNRKMMSEQYALATAFLRGKGIKWFDSYVTVFVWIDLRRFLLDNPASYSSSSKAADFSSLSVHSPTASKYLAREARIADVCANHGVMIAPGSIYSTEEYGWFRITFAVPSEPLKEGLDRLWAGLMQVEREGWAMANE